MARNAVTRRGTTVAAATAAPLAIPSVPLAISAELSRAMESGEGRGPLLPLRRDDWLLAQATADAMARALAVPLTEGAFVLWLDPFRFAVRNVPGEEEFNQRGRALFVMLADLPAVCFTPESRLLVNCEFFPSAAEIHRAVLPIAAHLQATIDGLRRIPQGTRGVAIEGPGQDPAIGVASVKVFRAIQELRDGAAARRAYDQADDE